MAARKKTITDAEWVITAQLLVGPDETQLTTATLRYADSQVVDGFDRVAWLIAGRLNEVRERVLPVATRKKR